ncbi:hypothetical protein [Streptococcus mutans]|uniref:hypothetical protein n=1 Tax=Streptococcus mutans TaxID=1309 RepID=UPI0002B59A6F|nr:hypothetical protein [Streptococcus mutans]EMB77078.1 hypothetical protein SMU41_00670 [Streptococcus mutans 2VS1]EMP67158.1 hypothetical protein D819_02209 [Streptococcus mutans AC4446]NLQ96906.1 hypothetical protein [Streptococcus mutans]
MNTLTLDSMAFDNFEIANNEYLATTEGEGLGSALWGGTVEGLDKAFTWGAAGAGIGGAIGGTVGLAPSIPTGGLSVGACATIGGGIGAVAGVTLGTTVGFIDGFIKNY